MATSRQEATVLIASTAVALALALRARHKARATAAATSEQPQKQRRQKWKPLGQHSDDHPRFFAPRDKDGNLSINLRFIDSFLRWDCGRLLLGMGLFPNTQEISESMACLETIHERLSAVVSRSNEDVVAIVVGDGRTPRTAALIAMRTKWRVVSIDPALHGLEPTNEDGRSSASGVVADADDDAAAVTATYQSLPRELRHPNLQKQETSAKASSARAQLRQAVTGIQRLTVCPCRVQDAIVRFSTEDAASGDSAMAVANEPNLTLSPSGHVVIVLPHAHVTPDDALRCLRFDAASVARHVAEGRTPTISIVQLPCCGFVWHDLALGAPAELDYLDARIATSARSVRVWSDVAPRFDFGESHRGHGVPRRSQDLGLSNARKRTRAKEAGRKRWGDGADAKGKGECGPCST